MSNKHMKLNLVTWEVLNLVTWEVEIKTIMSFYYIPTKIAKIDKRWNITSVDRTRTMD